MADMPRSRRGRGMLAHVQRECERGLPAPERRGHWAPVVVEPPARTPRRRRASFPAATVVALLAIATGHLACRLQRMARRLRS